MTVAYKRQRGLDVLKPYVPGKPIEEVQREYGLSDVIKLASNENPLGVSPKVLAALQGALVRINQYPDAQAYRLRRALAQHHGVDPEMVRVGNGADALIREFCVAYLEDGDEVVTGQSSFTVYEISTAVMRGRIVKTPLRDLRFDLEAMADAITERTKLVFVCNPNNPTGTMVTGAELERFLARAPERVVVVVDEAYYEFVESAEYPDSLKYVRSGRENVVVLRTFSKAYGIAGIRIGYALGAAAALAPLRASTESFPVNLLAQVAGEAALGDTEFLHRTVAANHAGREYLYQEFRRLGLKYAESQTNFVMFEVGPRVGEVNEQLLRHGVIVRPCAGYDLPAHLRVTVGSPAENRRFITELEHILAML